MGFWNGEEQIVRGIPDEIVNRLVEMGASRGHLRDPLGFCDRLTPVDPVALRLLYFEMLAEAGVRCLWGASLAGVDVCAGRLAAVRFAFKDGTTASVSANVFIDATGDADLAALSGAECVLPGEGSDAPQPMTTIFTMRGVDFDPVRDAIMRNPKNFYLAPRYESSAERMEYVAVSGYYKEVRRGGEDGSFAVPRDRLLFFQGVRDDEACVNTTRIGGFRGQVGEDISRAQDEGVRQVFVVADFLKKRIAGFERAWIDRVGEIGVRESRRIVARATLCEDDLLSGRVFRSSVAIGGYPIDVHSADGAGLETACVPRYGIPFEIMLPRGIEGLLVTGRAVGMTHLAAASVRITATAMALGQAAGTAAALCAFGGIMPSVLDVERLQDRLDRDGVVF